MICYSVRDEAIHLDESTSSAALSDKEVCYELTCDAGILARTFGHPVQVFAANGDLLHKVEP